MKLFKTNATDTFKFCQDYLDLKSEERHFWHVY